MPREIMQVLAVRLPPDDIRRLQYAAHTLGLPASEIIRDALRVQLRALGADRQADAQIDGQMGLDDVIGKK